MPSSLAAPCTAGGGRGLDRVIKRGGAARRGKERLVREGRRERGRPEDREGKETRRKANNPNHI